MKKYLNKESCGGILIIILFIAIIAGLVFFLGRLSTNRFEFERLIVYSIMIIFGITLGVETCLFKKLRNEEVKLKQELEKVKKELEKIKK